MKKILAVAISILTMLATTGSAEDFNVSVDIPAANSANFIVFKVTDPNNFPKDPIATANLAFTTTLNTQYNTFLGNEYYAINVQPTGGAGNVSLLFFYWEGAMPAGQTNGLGGKATVSVSAVNPATNGETSVYKRSLNDCRFTTVRESAIPSGQYMRVYIGLANGQEDAALGVTPFTTGDKPGDYSGTLMITALAS